LVLFFGVLGSLVLGEFRWAGLFFGATLGLPVLRALLICRKARSGGMFLKLVAVWYAYYAARALATFAIK
jgi:hypothetical protein